MMPPSFRFPPLREGNREGRAYSVPPACRGNHKEKEGFNYACFYKLWSRDWYYPATVARAGSDHAPRAPRGVSHAPRYQMSLPTHSLGKSQMYGEAVSVARYYAHEAG
jgi:hypothetical protein